MGNVPAWAIGTSSQAQTVPRQSPFFDFYAGYVQNDFKLHVHTKSEAVAKALRN